MQADIGSAVFERPCAAVEVKNHTSVSHHINIVNAPPEDPTQNVALAAGWAAFTTPCHPSVGQAAIPTAYTLLGSCPHTPRRIRSLYGSVVRVKFPLLSPPKRLPRVHIGFPGNLRRPTAAHRGFRSSIPRARHLLGTESARPFASMRNHCAPKRLHCSPAARGTIGTRKIEVRLSVVDVSSVIQAPAANAELTTI